jgi:TonB family protein
VRDAQVLRSIPMLDAAAVAAVRQWRFQAAGPDGRPDPLTITVPVIIPASRH